MSKYRCDALIVTLDGVQWHPLGALTGDDVVRHAAAFLGALEYLHRDDDDFEKRRSARDTVTATLRWLWEAIASPLLPSLLAAGPGSADAGPAAPRPRVWWCPTGPLTFLPLHAAGVHDGGGDAVLDHVVSSYALTLRLLLRAQGRPHRAAGGAPDRGGTAETPGQPPLPGADDGSQGVVADGSRVPASSAAPRRRLAAVTKILKGRRRWRTSPATGLRTSPTRRPAASRCMTARSASRDVAGMRLEAAELAFLSACETARGGIDLVDEAITVAAAFQLAGYRHVVGTLWSISDGLAPDIARHVYRALTHGGTTDLDTRSTAAALDSAIRANRDEPSWRGRRTFTWARDAGRAGLAAAKTAKTAAAKAEASKASRDRRRQPEAVAPAGEPRGRRRPWQPRRR